MEKCFTAEMKNYVEPVHLGTSCWTCWYHSIKEREKIERGSNRKLHEPRMKVIERDWTKIINNIKTGSVRFGFMPGWGMIDAIFILDCYVDKNFFIVMWIWRWQSDSVRRPIVEWALRKWIVPCDKIVWGYVNEREILCFILRWFPCGCESSPLPMICQNQWKTIYCGICCLLMIW